MGKWVKIEVLENQSLKQRLLPLNGFKPLTFPGKDEKKKPGPKWFQMVPNGLKRS